LFVGSFSHTEDQAALASWCKAHMEVPQAPAASWRRAHTGAQAVVASEHAPRLVWLLGRHRRFERLVCLGSPVVQHDIAPKMVGGGIIQCLVRQP
jgi:hypothetical protein